MSDRKLDLRVYGPPSATREQLEAQLQMLHRVTAVLVERLGGKVVVTQAETNAVWNGKLTVGSPDDLTTDGIAISFRRRS